MRKAKNKICIIGLGFVGLTLATVMANRGYKVYGVEKNKLILNKLKQNKSHFFEPGLSNNLFRIIKNKSFQFSKHIPKIKGISTYIVTVGTPLNNNKKILISYISRATKQIAKVIDERDLVILRSTVKIGTTRNIVYPILKRTKKKFSLAFCPERAVEGSALKELNYLPQVIGGIDKKSIQLSVRIFKKITKKIVVTSNVETAEMIKLIDNSSRDVFFAYANEIARTCDKIGLDANEVINSGKLYYDRTDIAKPGLVGGPCLYKDPYIFSDSCSKSGVKAEITLMARKINERQPSEIVKFIYNYLKKNKKLKKSLKISLIGLAFKGKPITNDLRGSMAINVYKCLKSRFIKSTFYGFDPVVEESKIEKLGLKKTSSLTDSFRNKDLIVILNNHPVFSSMKINSLSKKLNKNALIYDFWNHFYGKKLNLSNNSVYLSLGSHFKANKILKH